MDRARYAVDFIAGVKIVGLAVVPTGTANDTVANFLGAPDVDPAGLPLSQWLTATNDAAAGSTFKFTRRGLYVVTASIVVVGAGTVFGGLSMDAAPASLTTDPLFATSRFQDAAQVVALAASTVTMGLESTFTVNQDTANNPTLAIVRLSLSNGAGAAPAGANLTVAQCGIRIVRVGDCV